MGKLKYYYNPKTFQYDRVKRNVWAFVWYTVGLIVVSAVFFAGIFFLDNLLFETSYEAQLRFENKSLKKHKALLTNQLVAMEGTLTDLQKEDKKLYAKIFSVKTEEVAAPLQENISNDLLYTSLSSFRKKINSLQTTSSNLFKKTKGLNRTYSYNSLDEKELAVLTSTPSLLPVDMGYANHLVSGFGERINPFHKGKYEHPGIDFSIPRGSSIYATGAGKVLRVNKSNLQAGYGNYIEIEHGNGYVTRYAHLENILVKAGQQISKGEAIATSGMSGGSVSPHLHYEVLQYDTNIDPIQYLIQGITPALYSSLVSKAKAQNQSLD